MIAGNKARLVVSGSGTNQVLGPNPNRVGLIISSSSAGDSYWSLGADAANLDGIRMASGITPLLLLFDKPNAWITQPVSCWSPAGQTLNLVELVERPM